MKGYFIELTFADGSMDLKEIHGEMEIELAIIKAFQLLRTERPDVVRKVGATAFSGGCAP